MAFFEATTCGEIALPKILLVEDDQFLRVAVAEHLREAKFLVTEAPDGRSAKTIYNSDEFDLVVSDIQMPFLDGVELLTWIKSQGSTPVILLTGFTNLLDIKSAHELGAAEFFAKPFKSKDLIASINKILAPGEGKTHIAEDLDSQFCKVSLEEFVSRTKIEFDVFIRLNARKYVKIGVAGSEIPAERIRSYQQKGAQYLHIAKKDFAKLVNFNLDLSKALIKSDSISQQKKINFVTYTAEVFLEKVFVDGIDKNSLNEARSVFDNTVAVLSDNPEQLALLDILNGHSNWVYAHSVATSIFAVMIARLMGHSMTQVFFKLGMAGMFHEIGYKEIPQEILDKARPLLTQKERTMIESHVTRGREILSSIKGIPEDVIEIVYQHHEDNLEMGYPRRLPKDRIHPLAKIFQAADIFADVAMKNPHHEGMSGPKALAYVESFHSDKIDPKVLLAMKKLYTSTAS